MALVIRICSLFELGCYTDLTDQDCVLTGKVRVGQPSETDHIHL